MTGVHRTVSRPPGHGDLLLERSGITYSAGHLLFSRSHLCWCLLYQLLRTGFIMGRQRTLPSLAGHRFFGCALQIMGIFSHVCFHLSVHLGLSSQSIVTLGRYTDAGLRMRANSWMTCFSLSAHLLFFGGAVFWWMSVSTARSALCSHPSLSFLLVPARIRLALTLSHLHYITLPSTRRMASHSFRVPPMLGIPRGSSTPGRSSTSSS